MVMLFCKGRPFAPTSPPGCDERRQRARRPGFGKRAVGGGHANRIDLPSSCCRNNVGAIAKSSVGSDIVRWRAHAVLVDDSVSTAGRWSRRSNTEGRRCAAPVCVVVQRLRGDALVDLASRERPTSSASTRCSRPNRISLTTAIAESSRSSNRGNRATAAPGGLRARRRRTR